MVMLFLEEKFFVCCIVRISCYDNNWILQENNIKYFEGTNNLEDSVELANYINECLMKLINEGDKINPKLIYNLKNPDAK